LNNILTAREAGVLLHTCLRLLPSATAVLKFILGRSLHTINCSWAKPLFNNDVIREGFSRRDWPQKNMLAVLDGGMWEWHVRSNTQQRQMLWFALPFMPCIARWYLRIRNATYFSKALNFCYFLFKQKVKEKNIQSNIIETF